MNNQKSIAGLLIGAGLVLYAIILKIGYLNDVLEYLEQAKTIDVHSGVALWVGIIVLLVGISNFIVPVGRFKHDSIVRAPAPGIGILILLCILNRYYLEPIFKIWGKAFQPALGFDFATIFGFNYILLGIIIGFLWANIIKIPAWMLPGVKTGRLILKMAIITMGAMYSITEIKHMGSLSIIMIFVFVMGTVFFVLWFGKFFETDKSLTGVLASGLAVCGVSAAVAVAPVVKARSIDVAYSIGMLLLVGVVGLLVFPPVGKAVGMNEIQFGAWVGTGLLNSAQVAAAALVFDPHTIETLKVAEIFNITRVLILPLIVVVLALWYAKGEAAENVEKINVGKVLIDKFPIFVIGFILMFALMSVGFFTPKGFELHGKDWYNFTPSEKKQLKKEELAKIKNFVDSGSITNPMVKEALEKLLVDKQITSTAQADHVLKAQDFTKDKELKKLFKDAVKKVHEKPITIEIMREYMLWFFAYGLSALGMQITWQSMKQAGGKAVAVIGAITGFLKAFLSFWVCLFLLKETI